MRLPIIVPTLLCVAAGTAQAVEFAGVEVHGFFSQGYINSSDNVWLADDSETGSWDLNEAGINLSYDATSRIRLAGAIYASNMWEDKQVVNGGSFDQSKVAKVNLDYLYVQGSLVDEFGLRVGRVKQAYGFYNEVRDLDVARSTAILPQAVYDNRDRETNFLATGVAGYGSVGLGSAGSFDWQAYWGTTQIPSDGTIANQYATNDVKLTEGGMSLDAVVGGQVMYSPPVDGLRLGVSFRQLQGLEAQAYIPPGVIFIPPPFGPGANPYIPMTTSVDAQDFWLFSLEYLLDDWTFQAEYQRVKSRVKYNVTGGGPPWQGMFQAIMQPQNQETEGFYGLLSYRVLPQVEAGFIGSAYFQNWQERVSDDWNTYQIDYGAFARYDVTDWWTLKAEGHYVQGAGLLDKPAQATGYFPGSTVLSTEYWTYFVARTTFNF